MSKIHFTNCACYHDDLVSVHGFFTHTGRDLYEILQENSAVFEVQIQIF